MNIEEITKAVVDFIEAGENPNELMDALHEAIMGTDLWAKWGDGQWRLNTVCSICGSLAAGLCGHQDNPEQEVILAKEYRGGEQR